MKDYLGLLLDFQGLPRLRRGITFMEISGYPHYENVCSNILAFYFDPAGEHGLGDLLLKAFVKMAKARVDCEADNLMPFRSVEVSREHPMLEGKRIDLLISSEAFTIGIENKIHHWEANEFEIYAKRIDALGSGKSVIKAVLCLRADPDQAPPGGGFVRYTYPELWRHVRDLLGHRLSAAAPKWTIYLNEFMETTGRLAGETEEEKEVTDFFMRHHELIERLVGDRHQLQARLRARLWSIHAGLANLPETSRYLKLRGICDSDILVSHFEIQGKVIGFDLVLSFAGWTLMIWQHEPHDVVNRLRESVPFRTAFPEQRKNGDNFILRQWDLHVGEVELRNSLVAGFLVLIAAADSLEAVSV